MRILEQGQRMKQVRSDIPVEILSRNFQQFNLWHTIMYSINGGKEDLQEWLDVMFELYLERRLKSILTARRNRRKRKRK